MKAGLRALVLPLVFLAPAGAMAQSAGHPHQHGAMDHHQHMMQQQVQQPLQPGQGAFAAIQEIVQILEADPHTDWSKVDIEALRQHLVDMSRVTLEAQARSEPLDGGLRFVVTGPAPVAASIRRMLVAHAATMNGTGGWQFAAAEIDGGATLEVRVPQQDLAKLKALGFIGVMTHGMHHQAHHLMIARGEHPHG